MFDLFYFQKFLWVHTLHLVHQINERVPLILQKYFKLFLLLIFLILYLFHYFLNQFLIILGLFFLLVLLNVRFVNLKSKVIEVMAHQALEAHSVLIFEMRPSGGGAFHLIIFVFFCPLGHFNLCQFLFGFINPCLHLLAQLIFGITK